MKRETKIHAKLSGFQLLTRCGNYSSYYSGRKKTQLTDDLRSVTCLTCRRLMKKEAR